MAATLQTLLEKAKVYLPTEKSDAIEEAYRFAEECHKGQKRASGVPYIEHPLNVAILLADLRQDAGAVTAALLHDVIEDCHVSRQEIDQRFGLDVSKLVDGVTKLSKIEAHTATETPGPMAIRQGEPKVQAENLRKMLVAMAEDVRVILIKLADRLHNMRTLSVLSPEKQQRIAQETLDVYAPLAHRLGIASLKWQLEDLAFQVLDGEKYEEIARMLAQTRSQREDFIRQVKEMLAKELDRASIKAEVSGRAKHIYSIHQKMERYAAQGKDFNRIYDLFALRVIVDDIATCYQVLGMVHSLWRPIPGEFDDYIANPRENMYQSLHTAVWGPQMTPFEIQIRTFRMHDVAEYGVAAHWRYKEGGHGDGRFEEKMKWLRQLLDVHQETKGAEEFVETVKSDIFQDQVFVYTPKGQVIELPFGATPIDFAYRIHTELGHRCVGSKVNGAMVSLDTPLRNGDTVEIVPAKGPKGPSLDWLNPDLGFVHTANARDKIRIWFRKRARSENIEQGRAILEREMRRLQIGISEEAAAAVLGFGNVDDMLATIGSGALSTNQLATKLLDHEEPPLPQAPPTGPSAPAVERDGVSDSVIVMGQRNMLTRLAQCCHPVPGDKIVGFITRVRGVTVHRKSCRYLAGVGERERIVEVTWGMPGRAYTATVSIEALDRIGLLHDITAVVSAEKVNIVNVENLHLKRGMVTEVLKLETTGAAQLSKLLSRLEHVKGVVKVSRSG
ncbi:MAG: bifunctional (p)ppGpp synthetase/guanosine-3',5'-bis(diphosphate) 3'-pyrophosphohydrolase [Chloroflexi bacterium]|nr:bifunctional (p)ppGpp synthetase/guanosine-3',5'-bis(diphosphate) 3'-pyrophosphohydrolase [Chloroflexota bacterium]